MRARDDAATVQLTKIRIKERVRAALDRQATRNRSTLNAEISQRLEASVDREQTVADLLIELCGGPRTAGMLLHLANLTHLGGERDRWLDDYRHFQFVRDKWNTHLDRNTPPVPAEVEEYFAEAKRCIAQLPELPENLFMVKCFVGDAPLFGLDAERRRELKRLLDAAEHDIKRGFGPPETTTATTEPDPVRATREVDPKHLEMWDEAFRRAEERRARARRREDDQQG